MDQSYLDRMVTVKRATTAARILFPEDYHDGTDCHAEAGREGLPCRICAERAEQWQARVIQVREAMKRAFA